MPEPCAPGAARTALMRVLRAISIFILACALAPVARAENIAPYSLAPAQNLAAEARAARADGMPLLVFFSSPDCSYCTQARRDYLAPMQADPAWRGRLHVVEVDITAKTPLTDFDGARVSRADFARRRGVRLVPVLDFLGPRGEPLARPLIGFTLADFYETYVERRVEEARGVLTKSRTGPAATTR